VSERLVAIRTCDECPQGGQYYDYCLAVQPHRHLEDDRPEIPHWCPLPNAASGWVPVEERPPDDERLPADDSPVLVLCHIDGHEPWVEVRASCDLPSYATHWQPLPPLPEDAE